MTFWRVIALAFATSIFVEAKFYQQQKREARRASICDPVYNNTNDIQCYCTVTHNPETVRSASCHLVKINILPDDTRWNKFETLKDTNKLIIANTRGIALTYIPTNAIKLMHNLLKLDIKYGNIEKIEPFAFANLTLIEEISLSDNQMKVLSVNAFAHHRELSVINLDTNNIVEINRDVFIDLPSLEKLFLTNNKITTIHDKAFVHLLNLRELEIDRNNLFSLNSETFSGLKSLQKLDLSGNNLEVIGDNTFLPLKNLRTLNLEDNKIQMIDEKAFNGLLQLNALTLAHNKLTTIENVNIFKDMKSLTLLSLKSNHLIELKPQLMEPILQNFYGVSGNLDVEDNKFPCDCRLDWFMSLMNKTQNNNLKLATENLKCIPNARMKELWEKTEELEKNVGQVFDVEEESQVQNTDYEYYDTAQLDGKLFYIDVRELANCTNTTHRLFKPHEAKPQTVALDTTTKLTTKVNSSPTSTSVSTTQDHIKSSTAKNTVSLTDVVTKKKTEDKIDKIDNQNETKNKESVTTVRLATVSAKPLQQNIYDQDMASDEARPEKKAHRSIQEELKHTPESNHNNAFRNVHNVALVSMIVYLRLYFY